MKRRFFLFAAPAIVAAPSLMPISTAHFGETMRWVDPMDAARAAFAALIEGNPPGRPIPIGKLNDIIAMTDLPMISPHGRYVSVAPYRELFLDYLPNVLFGAPTRNPLTS